VARYHGGLAAALVAGTAALLTADPLLLVLGLVPLAYVAYGTGSAEEPPVAVERSFDPERPGPGEAVTVTLTVTNEGDRTLPDLRVADGVPERLAPDGEPGLATALRPGERASVEYTVRPRRGSYEFGAVAVRSRGLPGTAVAAVERSPGTDSLACEAPVDELPVRDRAAQFAGRAGTDAGGSGTEFYAVREYRRGDPRNRIDWRRLARTGELATVEFLEERATATVFVVDARDVARVEAVGDGPGAGTLSAYCGARGLDALRGEGNAAGITTVEGVDSIRVDVPAGRGEADAAVAALFERVAGTVDDPTVRATDAPVPGGEDGEDEDAVDGAALARRLVGRLPGRAQVVVCTPLVDGVPVALARGLAALDVPVTVLSPDVTAGATTAGGRAAAQLRRSRLADLRESAVPTVDWDPETPLGLALGRLERGGRR
jgi:uncharacterized protein (DUF58 family)